MTVAYCLKGDPQNDNNYFVKKYVCKLVRQVETHPYRCHEYISKHKMCESFSKSFMTSSILWGRLN